MPRLGDVSADDRNQVLVSNICIDISIYHDIMDTSYNELD
jgi:hypothetical protein